ncbi:MAG: hypothetical protein HC919_04920 [Oscillatoriales cyanobacterium SM2_2_1]|nr:hypothetical protein [Oscillatoriales cyanobacterium SM2_2_1]
MNPVHDLSGLRDRPRLWKDAFTNALRLIDLPAIETLLGELEDPSLVAALQYSLDNYHYEAIATALHPETEEQPSDS